MDNEIERIEKSEAWEDTDTVIELKSKKPLDKVIPVRLQAEHWEKLRELAGETGVGPTTLARIWLLERLRLETTDFKRSAIRVSDTKGKYLKVVKKKIQ